ncbi:MAG TPA: glycosyltransferase family 39 protein [Ktedonobacterales bacterium]
MLDITLKRPAVAKRAGKADAPLVSRRTQTLIIASIISLAALLDLWWLGKPSIWMDEAISIDLARQPLHTLAAAFTSGVAPNMGLYFLLLHGWIALGSFLHIAPSEVFIRLPSAVFAILASVVVYLLGERFFGRFAAIVAALAFTANGWQLTYAQDARSYSLQLLLVSLTWLGLFAALRPDRLDWRWWSVFVVAGALSVYAQSISGLALVALGVTCGLLMVLPTTWRERVRRAFPAIAAGFVAIGVLIAPFAYVSRHAGASMAWVPAPTLSHLAQHAATVALKYRHALGLALVVALVLALLVALAVGALLSPWGRRQRAWLLRQDGGALKSDAAPLAIAVSCWLVVPVVASYLISLGPSHIFTSRYLIVVLPALSLLVGAGVARLPWRALRLGLCVGGALALLALLPAYYANAQVEDWRAPTQWLAQHYQPGDGLVAYNNLEGCQLPVAYYLWADGSAAHFTPDSPGALHVDPTTYGNPEADYLAALDPAALSVYVSHHPRIFFIEGRLSDNADVARVKTAQAWLDAHYHFLGQTSSGIVTIRLYGATS